MLVYQGTHSSLGPGSCFDCSCDGGEVSMHSSVLYSLNSLSPQELFGGVQVVRRENDTIVAGFIEPFSYDRSFRGLSG